MSSTTVWDQVLSRIEGQVGRHTFSTWFKPTSMLADLGKVLKISVPNPLFVEWLPKHYSVVLSEALREVGRAEAALEFVPDAAKTGPSARQEAPEIAKSAAIKGDAVPRRDLAKTAEVSPSESEAPRGSLIPRYTFD